MDKEYGPFIVKIIETLTNNGYPNKKVSLPLEKMYEVAHSKGLNFNKVLEFLSEREQISHSKTDEKIIFFQESAIEEQPDLSQEHLENVLKQGEGMSGPMGKLFSKAKGMLDNMSPEQVQGMMKMMQNMPESQKKEMMEKAKDMGLL